MAFLHFAIYILKWPFLPEVAQTFIKNPSTLANGVNQIDQSLMKSQELFKAPTDSFIVIWFISNIKP